MRPLFYSMILVLAALSTAGCQRSEESYGEIITDMSQAPGADKQYKLPNLGEIEADESAPTTNSHQGHDHD